MVNPQALFPITFVLCAIFGTCSSGFAQESEYIHPEHQLAIRKNTFKVSIGRTARIQCNIPLYERNDPNQENITVSWLRVQDVNLLSVGELVYTKDKRISVECTNYTQCYLVIAEIREFDAGLYQCQANVPPGSWDIWVEVVKPVTTILGDREVYINPNSLLNLTCQVKSPEPPHAIFWKYGDQVLSRTLPERDSLTGPPWTAQLLIMINQRSDAGKYVCSPSNTDPAYISVHIVDGEALSAKQAANHGETRDNLKLHLPMAALLIHLVAKL